MTAKVSMKSKLDGLALRRVGFKGIRYKRLNGIRLRRSFLRSVMCFTEQIYVTKGVTINKERYIRKMPKQIQKQIYESR